MEMENDFVNEDIVELEIEGKMFKYKPTTAGDEVAWMDEYMEIVDGKPKQNLKKVNECKIRNLIGVPYNKELIKKIINIDKDWKNLNHKEKWKLMCKLKPKTFDKIIIAMNKIDSNDNEIKKN